MVATPDLRRHLYDLEERVAGPAGRSSRETLENLLADDFVEIGSSGKVLDRAAVVAALSPQAPQAWSIADFKLVELADGIAHVTYIATQAGRGSSHRSSIWSRIDGRWRMVFHQGTRIAD